MDDKLAERLKSYEGKEITPDSIDEVINIMLDYENNSIFGVRVPTDGLKPPSLIFDIAQYAEYLKPETIDKLLNTDFVMNNTVNNDHSAEVKNMRTLYNRMTPEQKQKYYLKYFRNMPIRNQLLTAGNQAVKIWLTLYLIQSFPGLHTTS